MRRAVSKAIPKTEDGCLSEGSSVEVCARCRQLKYCKKYQFFSGSVRWICKPCRKGQ